MVHPRTCSPCCKAAARAWASASFAVPMSTPTRRTRSGCCALAANGHAAAPPSSVMNLRRFLSNMRLGFPHALVGSIADRNQRVRSAPMTIAHHGDAGDCCAAEFRSGRCRLRVKTRCYRIATLMTGSPSVTRHKALSGNDASELRRFHDRVAHQ